MTFGFKILRILLSDDFFELKPRIFEWNKSHDPKQFIFFELLLQYESDFRFPRLVLCFFGANTGNGEHPGGRPGAEVGVLAVAIGFQPEELELGHFGTQVLAIFRAVGRVGCDWLL